MANATDTRDLEINESLNDFSPPKWNAAEFSPLQTFDELAEKLNILFFNSHVNIDEVKAVLEGFSVDKKEWMKYAHFDPYRYTRNLVSKGNGVYNLLILCWGETHASGVHDHAGSHCFMKTLSGEVVETIYDWPEGITSGDDALISSIKKGLKVRESNSLKKGSVAYIHDKIGLHRVENPSHTERATTLHLYCPPYQECVNFDESTGRAHRCQVTFWSEYGERTPFAIKHNRSVFTESH